MDPVQSNTDDNSTEEPSFDELILPSTPEICGISGDQQVFPRIGDEFQAEIPPLISETENFRPLPHSSDSEGLLFDGYHFFMGLPMAATWIHDKKTAKKEENSDNGKEPKPIRTEKYLVPGSLHHSWSDSEVDSFILGLYLFGKNLVKIKRFLSEKEMGDILSFYYGEFYGSEGYRKWSDRLRARRKKCIYGRKLFTGWRKEEFLSRLHPHVPEHSLNFLLEFSASFSEGKVSLENYVCQLKEIVGIEALVDAIGIGKAKKDLTSLSMEPGKSNPLFGVCPSRKACSSLTCTDIINLLTGGFRLSKARCNDIFWEAVWPRLLARGWHSEQPRNQNFLVFLIPGVVKFSKKRLVKGKQYFDCVSDVLDKVASEPKLIKLENEEEEARADSNEEKNKNQYLKPRVPSLKLVRFTVVDSSLIDGGKLCKTREIRYMPNDLTAKPLFTSLSNGVEMKCVENSGISVEKKLSDLSKNRTQFTIVDTSLRNSENSLKVRELRFAPRIKGGSLSRKTKVVQVSDTKNEEKNADYGKDTCDSDNEPLVNRKIQNKLVKISLQDKQNESARTIKHQFSRRPKSSHSNDSVPVVKRRKLTACSSSDLNRVIKSFGHGSKREGSSRPSNTPDKCSSFPSQEVLEENSRSMLETETPLLGIETSQIPSEKVLEESSRSMLETETPRLRIKTSQIPSQKVPEEISRSMLETETPRLGIETSQSRIDLNKPQVPLNSGNDTCHLFDPDKPNSEALSVSLEESNANPVRQSKRNRPLTTRALEALEYGFISMKRQRSVPVYRKRKASPNGVSISRERVANGHPEKKDLVHEAPVKNLAENDSVIDDNIAAENCSV